MGRPWLLGLLLVLVTAGIVAALADSEVSGTGAENVGESGPERAATPAPPERERERRCEATESNPGGPTTTSPTRLSATRSAAGS